MGVTVAVGADSVGVTVAVGDDVDVGVAVESGVDVVVGVAPAPTTCTTPFIAVPPGKL